MSYNRRSSSERSRSNYKDTWAEEEDYSTNTWYKQKSWQKDAWSHASGEEKDEDWDWKEKSEWEQWGGEDSEWENWSWEEDHWPRSHSWKKETGWKYDDGWEASNKAWSGQPWQKGGGERKNRCGSQKEKAKLARLEKAEGKAPPTRGQVLAKVGCHGCFQVQPLDGQTPQAKKGCTSSPAAT